MIKTLQNEVINNYDLLKEKIKEKQAKLIIYKINILNTQSNILSISERVEFLCEKLQSFNPNLKESIYVQ